MDFGSQFTQLIARAVRSLGVYCEIEPYSVSVERLLETKPKALILSGGPQSVGDKTAPTLVKSVLDLNTPVLGICYGMQLLSHLHQGKVARGQSREYGCAEVEILKNQDLFAGFRTGEKCPVWMSHGDSVETVPDHALVTARSERCPVAAFQMGNFHAVQFHPEVAHTPIGTRVLSNFLFKICGLAADWQMGNFLEQKSRAIVTQVGSYEVIGAVSGGVDSTVLAVFLARVLGKRFHPFLIDNGLLRLGEAKQVSDYLRSIGIKLHVVNASDLFLKKLAQVSSPESKRKIIGKCFIEVFERESERLKNIKFLAQGTLYPDVIESTSVKGPSHTIKTHHNVGGLPKRMRLRLIEPFNELFKDEVRELGKTLAIPEEILLRHPFPGPGLAVRVLGSVNRQRLELLRGADAIFTEELKKNRLYNDIWQAFVVLLPVKTVGVMGDARTYESVVSLRAVTSRDGMTADWVSFEKSFLTRVAGRIINEVRGINRVVYDISSKPPSTIEWE